MLLPNVNNITLVKSSTLKLTHSYCPNYVTVQFSHDHFTDDFSCCIILCIII